MSTRRRVENYHDHIDRAAFARSKRELAYSDKLNSLPFCIQNNLDYIRYLKGREDAGLGEDYTDQIAGRRLKIKELHQELAEIIEKGI